MVESSLGQQGGIRNNLGCPPNALELAPVERRGPSSFWSASPDPTVSAHGNHVPFKVSLSGARYLFHIFDMTYSMAVEIQPNGINTPGGRYGTFSSDLAPTTKAPRRSRGSKVGRYQADYRKFERLPWLAKIRVGGPRRLPPPRPQKRSDRQRRTKRQRRAPSPDGAADRCGTLEKRPPPKAA